MCEPDKCQGLIDCGTVLERKTCIFIAFHLCECNVSVYTLDNVVWQNCWHGQGMLYRNGATGGFHWHLS